jgi:hypothetical protein
MKRARFSFNLKCSYNEVHGIGPIYWIARDFANTNTPLMCIGIMKELGQPWRHGKGVQLRTRTRTLQIGVCKRANITDETDGILQAVGGREMDVPAQEIGLW